MNGPQQFAEWMERTGRSASDAASLIGVAVSTVYRWLDESRQPSLDQAVQIQAVTGIPVPAWAKPKEKTQ